MTAPVRTIGVKFEAQGVPEVQAAVRQVQAAAATAGARTREISKASFERSADSVREKWSLAGREITKSFADFGRTGQVAGRELKQLVIVGGEMAMTFGPAGPIASAVGLLTLGIVSMFKRARDEQEATQAQFMKGLSDMAGAADYGGLQGQAGKLWRGAFDPKTRKFSGGVGDLRGQEQALLARGANPFDLTAAGALKQFYSKTVISPLDGKEVTTEQLLEQYRTTIAILQNPLSALRGPRAPIGITADLSKDADAAKAAQSRLMQTGMLDNAAGARAAAEAAWRAHPYVDPAVSAAGAARLAAGADGAAAQIGKGLLPSTEQMQKEIGESIQHAANWVTDHAAEIAQQFQSVGSVIAQTIGDALTEGLHNAFAKAFTGDIAGAARALQTQILSALGEMFANIAMKMLGIAKAMAVFQKFLLAHPVIAVAAAAAMIAIARSMGGGGGGFGGGSYAATSGTAAVASAGSSESTTRLLFGADSTTFAAGLTPRSATNVTIIGPNDPTAQRAIQELIKKSDRRG